MNFGLDDIINGTIYGTPKKDLEALSSQILQTLNIDTTPRVKTYNIHS